MKFWFSFEFMLVCLSFLNIFCCFWYCFCLNFIWIFFIIKFHFLISIFFFLVLIFSPRLVFSLLYYKASRSSPPAHSSTINNISTTLNIVANEATYTRTIGIASLSPSPSLLSSFPLSLSLPSSHFKFIPSKSQAVLYYETALQHFCFGFFVVVFWYFTPFLFVTLVSLWQQHTTKEKKKIS